MAIQIDRMETSIEVTSSTPARPVAERTSRSDEAGTQAVLRDTVMQILSDELASYRRMRGH